MPSSFVLSRKFSGQSAFVCCVEHLSTLIFSSPQFQPTKVSWSLFNQGSGHGDCPSLHTWDKMNMAPAIGTPMTVSTPSLAGDIPPFSTSSLYVGDLHKDASESVLFEKFSLYGRILSVRVCRDAASHRSLGYAYVNFQNPTDAERAMEMLNFTTIMTKTIRIMWSQRDPALRRSGQGNIFIKNLDPTISTKDIYDTFSTFGSILSCKVAMTPEGISKGFGFVHYENQLSAQKAIDKVNGMSLCGRQLYVGHFISRQERLRNIATQPKTFTNLYIKNIPESWDDEKLKEVFGSFGETTSCHVMTDKEGKSRRFGFACFADNEAAEKALQEMNGKEMEGQTEALYVNRAQKKSERILRFQGSNLYIKNLVEEVTDEELIKEFEPFGQITSAKIMRLEDNKSRGFGFVCYSSPSEATAALAAMNQKMFHGKLLYVALAQRKAERRELLYSHFMQRASLGGGNGSYHNHSISQGGLGNGQGNGNGSKMGTFGQIFPPNNYFLPPVTTQPIQYYTQSPSMGNIPNSRAFPRQPTGYFNQGPMMNNAFGSNNRGPNRTFSGPTIGSRMPQSAAQRLYSRPGTSLNGPFPPRHQFGSRSGQFPLGMTSSVGSMSGSSHRHAMASASASGYSTSPPSASPATSSTKLSSPPAEPRTFKPALLHPQKKDEVPLTEASLALVRPSEQKQILGERLFPLVRDKYPVTAGKITGMLLDLPNNEILGLLYDSAKLTASMDEAVMTLEQAISEASPLAKDAVAVGPKTTDAKKDSNVTGSGNESASS